jgi:exodeoxyribonuclease VII small subunit
MKNKNFADNYQKLQEIATNLRNNQFMDIDQLLPMIKEATTAYQKCKSRLQAVQDSLDKHFDKEDVD